MQDHLLPFLPKGVDYKIAVLPPLCVSFMSLLFNFCSKNMGRGGSRNVSRSFSFYIRKSFFFFLLNVTFGWLKSLPPSFDNRHRLW